MPLSENKISNLQNLGKLLESLLPGTGDANPSLALTGDSSSSAAKIPLTTTDNVQLKETVIPCLHEIAKQLQSVTADSDPETFERYQRLAMPYIQLNMLKDSRAQTAEVFNSEVDQSKASSIMAFSGRVFDNLIEQLNRDLGVPSEQLASSQAGNDSTDDWSLVSQAYIDYLGQLIKTKQYLGDEFSVESSAGIFRREIDKCASVGRYQAILKILAKSLVVDRLPQDKLETYGFNTDQFSTTARTLSIDVCEACCGLLQQALALDATRQQSKTTDEQPQTVPITEACLDWLHALRAKQQLIQDLDAISGRESSGKPALGDEEHPNFLIDALDTPIRNYYFHLVDLVKPGSRRNEPQELFDAAGAYLKIQATAQKLNQAISGERKQGLGLYHQGILDNTPSRYEEISGPITKGDITAAKDNLTLLSEGMAYCNEQLTGIENFVTFYDLHSLLDEDWTRSSTEMAKTSYLLHNFKSRLGAKGPWDRSSTDKAMFDAMLDVTMANTEQEQKAAKNVFSQKLGKYQRFSPALASLNQCLQSVATDLDQLPDVKTQLTAFLENIDLEIAQYCNSDSEQDHLESRETRKQYCLNRISEETTSKLRQALQEKADPLLSPIGDALIDTIKEVITADGAEAQTAAREVLNQQLHLYLRFANSLRLLKDMFGSANKAVLDNFRQFGETIVDRLNQATTTPPETLTQSSVGENHTEEDWSPVWLAYIDYLEQLVKTKQHLDNKFPIVSSANIFNQDLAKCETATAFNSKLKEGARLLIAKRLPRDSNYHFIKDKLVDVASDVSLADFEAHCEVLWQALQSQKTSEPTPKVASCRQWLEGLKPQMVVYEQLNLFCADMVTRVRNNEEEEHLIPEPKPDSSFPDRLRNQFNGSINNYYSQLIAMLRSDSDEVCEWQTDPIFDTAKAFVAIDASDETLSTAISRGGKTALQPYHDKLQSALRTQFKRITNDITQVDDAREPLQLLSDGVKYCVDQLTGIENFVTFTQLLVREIGLFQPQTDLFIVYAMNQVIAANSAEEQEAAKAELSRRLEKYQSFAPAIASLYQCLLTLDKEDAFLGERWLEFMKAIDVEVGKYCGGAESYQGKANDAQKVELNKRIKQIAQDHKQKQAALPRSCYEQFCDLVNSVVNAILSCLPCCSNTQVSPEAPWQFFATPTGSFNGAVDSATNELIRALQTTPPQPS